MNLFAQIRAYIDTLVHPSVRNDPLAAARHRAFIAPRFIGGLLALTALPIHLAVSGVPGALEIFIYAWLATPVLIAGYLARTGHFERAHIMSSASLAALITTIGLATGGITSFAAVWLVVVPLEAALSASRRVVMTASAIAICAALLMTLVGAPVSAASSATLMALGIVSAALYATGLAIGSAALARTSSRLLVVEEDRYRLLARNITDVITRHRRNGMVRFASPAAESLFGMPAKTLLGHGLFDRVHVGDRPAYLTALADAAVHGTNGSVEFRIRREVAATDTENPAQFVWVEMRCRPLERTEGDSPNGDREVVAVIRDVSERKNQEEAIEAARNEAERANAAKSRFLATMSHELRTPLNAIIGFSEMLAQEEMMNLDLARRKEYATLIGESGHHLLSVVNGILDMSKIETGNFEITPEPFTPAPVIATICDLMALRARDAGIDLVRSVDAALPDIVADKRAVKQILINLLSNAIKFTRRNGRVTIAAEVSGTSMTFTVTDTGIGIAEEDLRHVGDPFFQVRTAYDRPHDGTGLGLSIVKGLVDLHGGELVIRSRIGIGTTVLVRLPMDCEKSRAEPARIIERLPLAEAVAPKDVQTEPLSDIRMKKSA